MTDSGVVEVSVPWSGDAPLLALVLDGVVRGAFAPGATDRGRLAYAAELPRGAVHERCDVLDIRAGRSVLPAPLALQPWYGLELSSLHLHAGRVRGSVRLNGWVGPFVGVELLGEAGAVVQSLAERQGGGEHARAEYVFDAPFRILAGIGQTRLSLRVGGHVLPGVHLDLTADDLGYAGFLDESSDWLQGWAVDLKNPKRRVRLDLLVDGAVVATTVADGRRKDIQDAGIGDGWCGFSFDMPPDGAGLPRTIGVVLSGTPTHLCNSPVTVQPKPTVQGYFDNVHGMSVHGWAWDERNPRTPVVVEAVGPDGRVLGTAEAKLFRGDLLEAGLGEGMCAFKIDIGAQFVAMIGQDISVRVAGTPLVLQGSPKPATVNPNLLRFLQRGDRVEPRTLQRLRRMMDHRAGDDGVSIVMPVHNPPAAWLMEAIQSVHAQWCGRWELICVNDCSTEPHVAPILAVAAQRDSRIRVLNSPANVGIAGATNFGIRAARYAYTAFMDHDDAIEPDAVWRLVRTAQQTGADFMYSDEAVTDEDIQGVTEVRARPAFSYDYYLSHPYFVHMLCVRTSIAQELRGWDESMAISADVDFVLRVLERARTVAHIPSVLYRWRTHGKSAGHQKMAQVMDATRGALQRHLDRAGAGATVRDGVWHNQFRVDWPATAGEVLVVIPTKNKPELLRTAINSVVKTSAGVRYRIVVIDHQSDEPAAKRYLQQVARTHTVMPYAGPFNYAAMNNLAVRAHGGDAEFVLFLNNDVEAVGDGWMDRMRRLANRGDVGAVGALLLYGDKRVQHAGVIMGFNGSADHALKFNEAYLDNAGRRNLGYNCSLSATRDFSAVTAACLMMRRQVFEAVRGFDERYAVGFNDTDLCLRVRKAGYKVLYDGSTILLHHESATRSETKQVLHPGDAQRLLARYAPLLRAGDPFYNPNLSRTIQDHVLREDAGCRTAYPPRVTELDLMRRPAPGKGKPRARRALPKPAVAGIPPGND